jgi:hypothetical protein
MLTATKLKVTLVLRGDELLTVPAVEGQARTILKVRVPDRVVSADIATKSLRKAQGALKESGADNVALILQGNLTAGDVVTDAGLVAQVKVRKEAV